MLAGWLYLFLANIYHTTCSNCNSVARPSVTKMQIGAATKANKREICIMQKSVVYLHTRNAGIQAHIRTRENTRNQCRRWQWRKEHSHFEWYLFTISTTVFNYIMYIAHCTYSATLIKQIQCENIANFSSFFAFINECVVLRRRECSQFFQTQFPSLFDHFD